VLETSSLLAEEQGLRVIGMIAKPVTEEKLAPMFRAAMPKAMSAANRPPRIPAATMRDSLRDGVLYLLYQPKIVMATGRLAGVEALVRWKHPEHGSVGPDLFVAVCEASPSLGAWLLDFTLREALAFAVRWSETDDPLNVGVNVHAGAFDDLDLPDRIEAMAKHAGVPPSRITLELTERSVAQDAVRTLEVATRLRLKGFGLAIDDFGTGHSGLSQLRRLPFNQLKIDRQFVHGATDSSTKRSVVEASIALARNLQMTSVAEGIERRLEWDLLQSLGCEEMQGYFTGRPMSEEGLQAWTAQWSLNQFAPTLAS
jgi:EAL domain-containing protein (putative c-di-GMP-specific phosphodiesterase class I)